MGAHGKKAAFLRHYVTGFLIATIRGLKPTATFLDRYAVGFCQPVQGYVII